MRLLRRHMAVRRTSIWYGIFLGIKLAQRFIVPINLLAQKKLVRVI